MMGSIRRKHRRAWLALVARGLLALAIGVYLLLRPLDSLAVIAMCIAIWAVLSGVTEVAHALEIRSTVGSWWLLFLGGFISIGFGVASVNGRRRAPKPPAMTTALTSFSRASTR